MIWQKISGREKLLLLLVLTLLWLFGFRYFYLPVFQKLNYEQSLVNLEKSKVEKSELELNLLHEEIRTLENKFIQLDKAETIEFSVSSVHFFLTEMSKTYGGEFYKIEMTRTDDQETPYIDLVFIWQGDYAELTNCFNFFKTLPWLLEEESVLLRRILTSRDTHLQWEYRCKLCSKRKDNVQAKESFVLEEESRNPFETK